MIRDCDNCKWGWNAAKKCPAYFIPTKRCINYSLWEAIVFKGEQERVEPVQNYAYPIEEECDT
jgi:hypothetical protein